MDTSLYVNLSHQVAVDRELAVIANNLANMNTAGFRAERTMFDDAMRRAGASDPVSFVIDRATYTDTSMGPIVETGAQFDVAVTGEGYLAVETVDGVQYTRDGRMVVSPDGVLTALDGSPVLDEGGGPINVPPEASSITIAADGVVSADDVQLGRIAVYRFGNELDLLRAQAGRFFARPGVAAEISPEGRLKQGAIEGSNVNPIREVTRLVELSRAYESAGRMSSDIHNQKKDAIQRLGGRG